MGLHKLKKPSKASSGYFYVQVKNAERWYLFHEFSVDNQKQTLSVPKKLYPEFGFNPSWTVMEAKERVKRLNSERRLEYGSHIRAARRAEEEVLKDETYFPEKYVDDFLGWLREQTHGTDKHFQKVVSHFVTMQRMVRAMKLTPNRYEERSGRIYNWLTDKRFSIDYAKKLIRVLNLWGQYIAKREGSYFAAVKSPRGRVRTKFKASQRDKPGVRRSSKALTVELLSRMKTSMSREHYAWVYLSFWFGLRPLEVDQLKISNYTRLTEDGPTQVLAVYQTKLVDIEEDESRWKYIPIIYPEQVEALKLLNGGEFKRPHPKTMAKHAGEGFDLYAGRKGFTDYMVSKGQSLDNVADWLGHSSTDTTRQHYKTRHKVNFTKTDGMLRVVSE